jgi:transposase
MFVKHKTAIEVSIKSQKDTLPKDIYEELYKKTMSIILDCIKNINYIEEQIENLIQKDHEIQKNSNLAQSVIGIGPVITWYLIATTNNFKNFASSRKYATYSGVAPHPNTSGKTKGKERVSQMANKKIKSLLSNGAIAAILHDPEIKAYYKRKTLNGMGKEKGLVINNVKNKLLARVFSVVNRGTEYVKMKNYA